MIVPTICRPEELRECLGSLASQTRSPDEVVVVLPSPPSACDEVVARSPLPIRTVRGSEGGIVHAVNLGLEEATGDVVCLVDDDAAVPAHWLSRIGSWFEERRIGAVGGPHLPPGGSLEDLPVMARWDRFTWFGYSEGPRTWARTAGPQRAHFLAEGGLAFRRELVPAIDARLVGRDERFGDDVTLGLLRAGYRVIADPELFVWHRHVRFAFDPDRLPAPGHVRAVAHNQTYLWLKHAPSWRRPVQLAFGLLVGDRSVKGLAGFLGWMARNVTKPKRMMAIAGLAGPTFGGRIDGIRTYLRARTAGG